MATASHDSVLLPRLALAALASLALILPTVVLMGTAARAQTAPSPSPAATSPAATPSPSTTPDPNSPSPGGTPCAQASSRGFTVSPRAVRAGDEVAVEVVWNEPCGSPSAHQTPVFARVEGEAEYRQVAVIETPAERQARGTFTDRPRATTSYSTSSDGSGQEATVTVQQADASPTPCSTPGVDYVKLDASPNSVQRGATVTVTVTTGTTGTCGSRGQTYQIYARRGNQQQYEQIGVVHTSDAAQQSSASITDNPDVSTSYALSVDGSQSQSVRVEGSSTAAGTFFPLAPARIYDSRRSPNAKVVAGSDRTIQVTGQGGIPASGVSAVVLNVTEVLGSERGDLELYPTGQQPSRRTSNLNYFRGQAVSVQAQTGLGTGGAINVSLDGGTGDVIVDVFGYYSDGSRSGGAGYTPLTPRRLLDTRTTGHPLVADEDRSVRVTSQDGVPRDATAVALNATVLDTPTNADLQLYPPDAPPGPRTSNVNVAPGRTRANAAVVRLSDGYFNMSISQGRASVVLDVVGYYSPISPGRFVPLTPQRIFDTRPGSGFAGAGTSVTSAGRTAPVRDQVGVPVDATAAVLSVTAIGAGQPLDLSVTPSGATQDRRTSTLNLQPAEAVANLAVTPLGQDGNEFLSASRSKVEVVLDVLGYFK